MKWFGFFDLSDLIGLEEKDFLNFKNIDNESLEEIKILLDSYGLKIPICLDQSTKLLPKEKIIDDSFEFVNDPDEIDLTLLLKN